MKTALELTLIVFNTIYNTLKNLENLIPKRIDGNLLIPFFHFSRVLLEQHFSAKTKKNTFKKCWILIGNNMMFKCPTEMKIDKKQVC